MEMSIQDIGTYYKLQIKDRKRISERSKTGHTDTITLP